MSRIQTTFTSDDSQIQRSLDKMQRNVEKLIEKQKALMAAAKEGGAAAVDAATQNGAAIQRLQQETLKLQDQEKKRQEENKRHGGQFSSMISDQLGSLKSMVLGYASVTAAVSAVVGAYKSWHAEMKALAESSERFNKENLKGLAQSRGGLENAPALIEAQQEHPIATRAQVAAAQQGVAEAAPSLPIQQRINISNELARAAPLFPDPADMRQFANAAGELADTLPDFKPADIADLALSLQRQGGLKTEQIADPAFQRATKILRDTGAMKPLEALSVGAEAIDANLDPKSIEKLAAKLTEKFKPPPVPVGRATTADEKLVQAFAKEKDAGARLEMLRSSQALQQKVLGDNLANKFKQIDFDKAFKRAAVMERDVSGDYVQERVNLLKKTPEGKEALIGQDTARQLDVVNQKEEDRGRALERTRLKLDQMLKEDDLNWLTRWRAKLNFEMRNAFNELTGTSDAAAKALLDTAESSLAPQVKAAVQNVTGMNIEEDRRARDFLKQEKALREEEDTRRTGHKPGQQNKTIEEAPIDVPSRPEVVIPEPPKRTSRAPAALGPTGEQMRKAFRERQGGGPEPILRPFMEPRPGDQSSDSFRQRFRMPEAAPSFADQLAAIVGGQQPAASGIDSTTLAAIGNKIMTALDELNESNRATQRAAERLADNRRLPPGISPAAMRNDFNAHFESA